VALTLVASLATPAAAISPSPQAMPEFNGSVYAIAFLGDAVYVGGSFTTVLTGDRTYTRQRLAAFDARTGALLDWQPSTNGTVRALVAAGGDVYAAGDFTDVSGVRRDSLARIDAATGDLGSLSHRISGTAYALALAGGRLYLGGRFSAVDGTHRGNLAAFALADGTLDDRWLPSADNAVHTLATYGSRVYLGGAFRHVDGVTGAQHIAAVDAADGTLDPDFLAPAVAQVNGIVADTSGVYVATGGRGGHAIALSTTGQVYWQRVFDGDAVAIARLDGVTYVGGHFDRACLTPSNGPHGVCTGVSRPRVKLAAIDAAGVLSSWAPQANGVIGVRVIAANPIGTIAAGGDFTTMGGRERLHYASFG